MSQRSLAEASANFTQLVREAEQEALKLTRYGEPVVTVVPIEEYRRLRALDTPLRVRLRQWLAEHPATNNFELTEHR